MELVLGPCISPSKATDCFKNFVFITQPLDFNENVLTTLKTFLRAKTFSLSRAVEIPCLFDCFSLLLLSLGHDLTQLFQSSFSSSLGDSLTSVPVFFFLPIWYMAEYDSVFWYMAQHDCFSLLLSPSLWDIAQHLFLSSSLVHGST